MTRPTFDELRATQVDLIGPPRHPKTQPRRVRDFTDAEAKAMRDYLESLGWDQKPGPEESGSESGS